jgi:hypothetical protein
MHQRGEYTSVDSVLDEMVRLANQYKSTPAIRDLAQRVTKGVDLSNRRSVARSAWRWIRENVRYTRDPTSTELLQSPDRILDPPRYADCDGMAVLAASLLAAVGIQAGFRAIARQRKGAYDHVYAVYEAGSDRSRWHAIDPTAPIPPGPDQQSSSAESVKTLLLSSMYGNDSSDLGSGPASKGLTVRGSRSRSRSKNLGVYPPPNGETDRPSTTENGNQEGNGSSQSGGQTSSIIKTLIDEAGDVAGEIWGKRPSSGQDNPRNQQPTTPQRPAWPQPQQRQTKIFGMSPPMLVALGIAGGGVAYAVSQSSDDKDDS